MVISFFQKMRTGIFYFVGHQRARPVDVADTSLVQTRFTIEKEQEQSFNLSHCTLDEPDFKGVYDGPIEAHQKSGAYMRH